MSMSWIDLASKILGCFMLFSCIMGGMTKLKKIDSNVNLFKLPIFSRGKARLLEILEEKLQDAKLTVVFTPNPEQEIQAQKDPIFFRNLVQADILIPDGGGLVLATKILHIFGKSSVIEQKIPGREVVVDLLALAKKKKLRVLLVGGKNYAAIDSFQLRQQQIHWVEDWQNLDKIRQIKAELVFVALGAPRQEAWIMEHRALLQKHNAKLVMAVGGSFDYLLGKVPRAPKIISHWGGEWLFRLLTQPWRAKRQARLIEFGFLTIKELLKQLFLFGFFWIHA